MNLQKYLNNRNKILIMRRQGGLGDILMQRMMFEDIKSLYNGEVHFACLPKYFDAVIDHPFLDKVIDVESVDISDYPVWYDISYACNRYETSIAPMSGKHRSDIWADHCGISLTNHNMHINLSDDEIDFGRKVVKRVSNGKMNIAFCPISSMIVKNLLKEHIEAIKETSKENGVNLIGLHDKKPDDWDADIPIVTDLSIREWMGVMNACDGALTVDTSSFFLAGGLKKRTLGVFTFADGKTYGKYYETAETVQLHRDEDVGWCGPCYIWSSCPKCKVAPKPCLTELPIERITSKFKNLIRELEKDIYA